MNIMSADDDDKPPAPPVRLSSNRYILDFNEILINLKFIHLNVYYSFRLTRGDSSPNIPLDMKPLPKEPDCDEKKKKSSKTKSFRVKGSKVDHEKPNISYPTNFEHTVHVGFDAHSGEFTVSISHGHHFYSPKI